MKSKNKIEESILTILKEIGEDPEREGLLDTPKRVSKAYIEILSGYTENIDIIMSKTFSYDNKQNSIVKVNSIEFFSLCEHHMLPFFGTVDIKYIPNNKILGLSKFARLVDAFSKRLQVQENLTKQIGETIVKYLDANYVEVITNATHMCMTMRGVSKHSSFTETSFKYEK